MEQSTWAERLAATIAAEVFRYRRNLDLSAQALSDRTTELGHTVPRATISNLENGRRTSVSVAELLVLAAALDIPPAALTFPVGYAETTEALPEAHVPPFEAVRWLAGEEHSSTPTQAATGPHNHTTWRKEGTAGEAISGYRRAERVAETGLAHADRAARMRADAYDLEDADARDALARAAQKQDDQAEQHRSDLMQVLDTLHDLGATERPGTLHVELFRQTTRGTPPRGTDTGGSE